MSKYTKEEQTEIVRCAMNLEAAIQCETVELERLKNERFKLPPRKPLQLMAEPIQPEYPDEPKSSLTFEDFLGKGQSLLKNLAVLPLWLKILFSMIAISIFPVGTIAFGYVFWLYSNKKKQYSAALEEENKRLANSFEYVSARKAAEELAQTQTNEMNKRFEENYKAELDKYNNELLPAYNEELELWETENNMKINVVQTDLTNNKDALRELYSDTMLISAHNRDLRKLIWLYEDMSTSEHDIEKATERLDFQDLKNLSEITNMKLHEINSDMRKGFAAVYTSIQEGNDISSEIYDQLDDIRAKVKMGNYISLAAVGQRHISNKRIKEIKEALE